MKTRHTPYVLLTLLTLGLATGCKNDETTSADSSQPSSPENVESAEAKKKATVEALLRANGIDPATVNAPPKAQAPPQENAAQGSKAQTPATSTGTAPGSLPPTPLATIELLSAGSGPRSVLRYQFKSGRQRKFTMDMNILPKRVVNGQPVPGGPAIQISMSGTSVTESVNDSSAQRVNTFLSFIPSAEGAPPMMLAQMQAQFAGLKGIQLQETVSSAGQVLNMQIKQGSVNNPQAVALMQNLQEGMSNAFLPLPEKAVGVGAKWKGTTTVQTSGLTILQENTMHLTSLKGSVATVELSFKQSADKQDIQAPGLPPGAKVELVSMKGSGSGSMSIDLASLITDSKVSLQMIVDTKVTGTGSPQPVLSLTDTTMKIHMRVSE